MHELRAKIIINNLRIPNNIQMFYYDILFLEYTKIVRAFYDNTLKIT